MLSEYEAIDITTPIPPDGLMLVAMDMYPWPDADSAERLQQLERKLKMYGEYAGSDRLPTDHPNVSRTNLHILVMCLIPPSEAMTRVAAVDIGSGERVPVLFRSTTQETREIALSGAHESPPAVEGQSASRKPWWKFWS
jgi:hypothetical protein